MKRSGDVFCATAPAYRLTSLLRAEKIIKKSVVKNSIIKRGRFEAPPLRHMMYERCRTSIHENAYAPAARNRARSTRWSGRSANIGQTTKPIRSSCIYIAGCSSLANAFSKYTVPASRSLRHAADIAHRCSMRRPLRLPFSFFLKMYTKIIERHPLQIGRGILARATSVAALAPAPKPGRFLKKTMSKTLAFTAPKFAKNVSIYRARRHCGIPTQN